MPLDKSATQTTATNSATYLVNKRRRVFWAEISAGARGCALFPAARGGGREAKKRLVKSRILIPATLPGACRVVCGRVAASLDHSVGAGKQRRRQVETERLCRAQIDDQLEYGGLLDRQVARFGTPEDAVAIDGAAPIDRRKAGAIGHQAAVVGVFGIYRK